MDEMRVVSHNIFLREKRRKEKRGEGLPKPNGLMEYPRVTSPGMLFSTKSVKDHVSPHELHMNPSAIVISERHHHLPSPHPQSKSYHLHMGSLTLNNNKYYTGSKEKKLNKFLIGAIFSFHLC